ncbi:MAG: hypothetical protein ACFFDW_13430 [Candidatus Thorarchaeota archaeon]
MKEFKKDPLRSQARRDIIKALGESEIINKMQLVEITNLSPLTINAILREFRNYHIVTCHAGGMYALSGEGRECYFQLLSDKRFRKKEFERRSKEMSNDNENNIKKSIIIEEDIEDL